ncbi:MAG: PAS domain S-box protein [Chitinophagaceae bacterium]
MSGRRTTTPYHVRLRKRLKFVSICAGLTTLLIAFLFLAGYNSYLYTHLHIPFYVSQLNPMGAFSFLLAGTAVVLITFRPVNGSFMLFSIMVAWILIIQGAVRMADLFHLFDAKLDLLLTRLKGDPTDPVTRMHYTSAACFILLGIAFLLKVSMSEKRKVLQYILFSLIILSLFSVIGTIYGIGNDYPRFLSFLKMVPGSSICFLLVTGALLLGEYNYGVMSVITSNKTGGRMARMFLPFVLLFPLLLGVIHQIANRTGWFRDSIALAMFSLISMIVFFLIILRSARSNNNIHNWLLQEIEERKKAEQEFRNSNVFVNAIYENIPNMVFVKDGNDLRYKSINKAGEELIGHTRKELLGKTDYDFFLKEEADFFRSKDKEVFASNKPVIAEEPITTPDHGLRWLRTKKIVIRDETGNPLYMIGISEDITELKEKEEQLRKYNERLEIAIKERTRELHASELRYTQMIEEIQDYVIIFLDPDGKIINWNKGAERIKGYRAEEIIGENFRVFYPKEAREKGVPDRLLADAKQNGKTVDEGWRVKKDGSRFWAFVTITAVNDEQGNLIGFSKVTRDLTESKLAQDQKTEFEKRLRVTINSIGDNSWEHDFDTGINFFSDSIKNLLGYKPGEFTANKNLWWEIIYPEDKIILEENRRLYQNNKIDHHVSEFRIFHKDGSIKWILDRGVVIDRRPDGTVLRVAGIHMDITQRKEAEHKLIENETRFRDLTQNVPGVIYQWLEQQDGSFGFTYVSPKLREYFGIAPEEMHKLQDYVHPDDREQWRTSIEQSKKNNTPWHYEGRLLYPGGRILWWRGSSVIAVKSDKGTLYNGLLMDITEQKLIEQKIINDQKRYEAIFNSQFQFIGLTTPDGILTEVNEGILDFAGIEAKDVIGKHCYDAYWWSLTPEIKQQLKESTIKAGKGEFIRYETQIVGKGGKIAEIDFSIKPVRDDSGNIILLISEGRDITEKKLLEQKSSVQEEQIRLFVKHNPASVAMFDDQLRYMVVSDRWYKDYELDGQDIIGKSHYDIFPEINNMPEWKAIHQRCLQGAVEIREQDPFIRADGTHEWLRWEIHPWKTNTGKIGGIMLFTEVITERIKAKQHLEVLNKQLTESNRELEQFAYVASHDLQEPLRMVSSFLQLLEKKYNTDLDEKAKQYIHFAVDGSERMKTLINDLLKFSRAGTGHYDKKPVDCNDVIQNVIRVYTNNIQEEKATINVYFPMPVVTGSKTQLEQVFQNLIGNALKYHRSDPLIISIDCVEEETRWIFSVQDNGIGIDPKFFEKVFIIFQRLHAKNEYSGTGIGLAICKKIVERHGGQIWVESRPDKGSTFFFSLPKISLL